MGVALLQIASAVFLFYAVNWIGRHSSGYGYMQLSIFVKTDEAPAFNFVLKAFAPTVFIIIVAAVCYGLGQDRFIIGIWFVVVYYFAFRLLFNLALGRARLLNWWALSAQIAVGTAAAYLAYRYMILPKQALFPDPGKLGNQMWIIVALFVYAAFNNVRTAGEASAARKARYLRARYRALREEFGSLLDGRFAVRYMELVTFAILIYETFNRPWIAQKVERILFPWGSRTLGPMQVRVETRVTDLESVRKGIELLEGHFESTRRELVGKRVSQYEIIRLVLAKYNRDENYIGGIFELLHILWAQVAPEYRTEFEQMHRQDTVVANP